MIRKHTIDASLVIVYDIRKTPLVDESVLVWLVDIRIPPLVEESGVHAAILLWLVTKYNQLALLFQ